MMLLQVGRLKVGRLKVGRLEAGTKPVQLKGMATQASMDRIGNGKIQQVHHLQVGRFLHHLQAGRFIHHLQAGRFQPLTVAVDGAVVGATIAMITQHSLKLFLTYSKMEALMQLHQLLMILPIQMESLI